jgi:flagellar assembly factor FliW
MRIRLPFKGIADMKKRLALLSNDSISSVSHMSSVTMLGMLVIHTKYSLRAEYSIKMDVPCMKNIIIAEEKFTKSCYIHFKSLTFPLYGVRSIHSTHAPLTHLLNH